MANYIILNGKNSNTITGLLIQNLPPISKPLQRTLIEEIDGRDGDIVTKLGYGAYDKEITIGLYGSYNVDDVISYFDSEGVVTFSNEPDKYYNYQIIDQIDFERLIRFKTATVRMHVQPFKYLLNEPEIEVDARSVTGEGQNIELKYTIENGSLSITPKGNTEQTTYTGKNLFDINAITEGKYYWSDQNRIVDNANWNMSDYIKVNGNTNYIASYIKSTNKSQLNYSYYDENKNLLGGVGATSDTNDYSILTPANAYYIRLGYRIGGDYNLSNIQLEQGTSKTSFEPYVGGIPSPNPDYPQPVKVVTGNNTIKVEGKNLYGAAIETDSVTGSSNNVITDTSNKLEIQGISGFYSGIYKKYQLKPNTQYTISLKYSELSNGSKNRIYYKLGNNCENIQVNNRDGYIDIETTTTSLTFTTDNTGLVAILFCCNWTVNTGYIVYNDIQLEPGSIASDYEEYQSQTYSLNLGSIELCKIGTYQDYIYKSGDNWYKHSEIGKLDMSTITNWGRNTDSSFYSVDFANAYGYKKDKLLSNIFIYSTTTWESGKFGITSSGNLWISTNDNSIQIVDNLPNWLSNKNAIMYGALATPTNTEITDTDLINQLESINSASAYKEVTNISSTCASGNSLMYMSAVSVGMPNTTIKNNGNIFAKPILTIYGSGEISVYLDTIQVLQIDLGDYGSITIDVSQLEAYNESTGDLMNRNVIGDYSNLKINCGDNDLTFSGNVMGFTMTKYNRWL